MTERGAMAAHWILVTLALWVLTRVLPATGTRRKTSTAHRRPVTGGDFNDHLRLAAQLPPPRRSPYSADRAPLDGAASRLSRPYLDARDIGVR